MKKLLLTIVIAGSLSLTSCWKSTKNEESTTEVATDTTQGEFGDDGVDTTLVTGTSSLNQAITPQSLILKSNLTNVKNPGCILEKILGTIYFKKESSVVVDSIQVDSVEVGTVK